MATRRLNHEGSIYLRKDGLWCAQISVDGKRKSKYGTRRECNEWLRDNQLHMDSGTTGAYNLTVEKFLHDWLDGKELTLRPRTIYSYRLVSEKHILPVLGKMRLMNLRPEHLRELYVNKHNEGCGARTVQIIHAILHASLHRAVLYGHILRSPADMVERPRVETQEFNIFDGEKAQIFMEAAATSPFETIFYLALTTGMRQGELLGLKWSDIDYVKKTLYVQRQLQPIPYKGHQLVPPKTRSGRRKVSIGQIAFVYLDRHFQKQDDLRRKIGEKWQENGLIFTTTIGTPLACGRVIHEFKKILKDAGLPMMRFHDLRHTAISLLLENGIPVNTVQYRAGHSKASVTTDIYGHLITRTQSHAASIIEALVTPSSFVENEI